MAKQGPKTVVPRLRFPEFLQDYPWAVRLLGNDATFEKGRGVSKAEVDPNGQHQCIRYGELYTRYSEVIREVVSRTSAADSTLFFSQTNDVIVPASGETKEDIATASCVLLDGVALGGDLNVIRSPHNGVFLSYLLNGSQRRELAKVAQGDTVVHLYPRQLAALSIAFPDAAEQQKIADCLTSLDEVIAAQGRKVEALKAHKRGLMQQLFPREGETRPRLRFPEFRDAPEWTEKKLSSLVDLVSGMHLSPDQYSCSGEVPYFTGPSDFTNYVGDVRKWTSPASSVAMQHDTLITVKGSGVGECWYLEMPFVAMGRQLMAVHAKTSSSRFINQFLLTKRTRFEDLASGNLIPGLSRGDILDMVAPFPKKDEQQRIADCLSSLDTQIIAETHQLAALKTHKQGLMQQLFPAPEAAQV